MAAVSLLITDPLVIPFGCCTVSMAEGVESILSFAFSPEWFSCSLPSPQAINPNATKQNTSEMTIPVFFMINRFDDLITVFVVAFHLDNFIINSEEKESWGPLTYK